MTKKTPPHPTQGEKKPSLRDRKKQLTRERILDVAFTMFSERSFDEISVDDIAEQAMVSRATVYNYFKTKNEIYFGIGVRFFENVSKSRKLPAGTPGIDQVVMLADIALHAITARPILEALVTAYFNEINTRNLPIEQFSNDMYPEMRFSPASVAWLGDADHVLVDLHVQFLKYEAIWLEAIRNGKRDGTISNSMPDAHIAQYIYLLMSGVVDQMNLRKAALERVHFPADHVISTTLSLVRRFLECVRPVLGDAQT